MPSQPCISSWTDWNLEANFSPLLPICKRMFNSRLKCALYDALITASLIWENHQSTYGTFVCIKKIAVTHSCTVRPTSSYVIFHIGKIKIYTPLDTASINPQKKKKQLELVFASLFSKFSIENLLLIFGLDTYVTQIGMGHACI